MYKFTFIKECVIQREKEREKLFVYNNLIFYTSICTFIKACKEEKDLIYKEKNYDFENVIFSQKLCIREYEYENERVPVCIYVN